MALSGSAPENENVPDRSVGYMRQQGGGEWVPNTDTLPYRGTPPAADILPSEI